MNACNTGTYDYSFLENIPDRPSRLEGYLFPDTYEFYVGEENPENVVKRFLDNFANKFTEEMLAKVQQLDRENFAVRQHLRYVEKFADPASYQTLSYEDTLHLKEEVAPLLQPDMDEASAVADVDNIPEI